MKGIDEARLGRKLYESVAGTVKEEWFTKLAVPSPVPQNLSQTFEKVARRVYSLGLPPWVVDRHWEATKSALKGCQPRVVALMSDRELEGVLDKPEVLRNRAKLVAVRHNAGVLCALHDTFGGLAGYRNALSAGNVQSLLDDLRDRMRLVGPISAARIAQELGADCLVPHPSVLRTMARLGWCAEKSSAEEQQEAIERAAQKVPKPYPVARLSTALLAFSTGRWGATAFCEDLPQCAECPVWRDCARLGVQVVDAA